MKIYTRIVIDMETMDTVAEESFDYSGPVDECKGGSSSTTTVDYEYNRRMAAISERQQKIADEYFSYWNEYQKPYEIEQTQANQALLPLETEAAKQKTLLETQQAQAAQTLLPQQTELAQAKMSDKLSTIQSTQGMKQKFFTDATNGLDVNGQVAKAQADVSSQFADVNAAQARNMSRMGVNPNSGRFAGTASSGDIAKAAAVAGARSQTRAATEDTNFNRLAMGMQYRSA